VPWKFGRVPYADVRTLCDELDIPEAMAWTLVRRGLDTPEIAGEFIRADGPLDPPGALDGVEAIADALLEAASHGATIAIHGDYDCDGVCSTAILARPLRSLGATVATFLPSRFTDGYGVRVETVERLADAGTAVLVCVDCGTSSVDALTRAAELGMQSIILDHHLSAGVRAPGLIANPALGIATDDAPAAAGVVFAVIRALAERGGQGVLAPDPDTEIDLVALATVADAVPLVGQNRRLVLRGLAQMQRAPRPGIRALCRAAGVDPRTLDARAIGYTLAPVINAAGRLDHPDRALELLLSDDDVAALSIAEELWRLNADRREVEQRITAEAIAQIEASPPEIRDAHAIVAIGDRWHEGVVGIVASRLVDHFDRPTLVLTRDGDVAKGSGRSLPGFDLHDLLGQASGRLGRWGGHAGAVGLQLPASQVAAFRDEFLAAAAAIGPMLDRARVRPIDAVVGARELTLETAEAFEALAPFGRGNPQPRLLMPGCTTEAAGKMGADRRHMNVRLHCGGAHLRAVGFGHGHRVPDLRDGARVDVQVALGVERYQGLVGPRVTINHIEPVTEGRPPVGCAVACDRLCGDRITAARLRDAVLGEAQPVLVTDPALPRGVDDQRGAGVALVRIASLAGADGGVAVVVGDIPRRRAMLTELLHPDRIGVEIATLAGVRCAPDPLSSRLELASRRPGILLIEYAMLTRVAVPDNLHLVVLDPPSDPGDAARLRTCAANRWTHLVWTRHEAQFMRDLAAERWDLRPLATAIWRELAGHHMFTWSEAAAIALAGDGSALRHPDAVADVLAAFGELGLLEISADGLTIRAPDVARSLESAPRIAAAAARFAEAQAYLDLAASVDVFDDARDALATELRVEANGAV
jgi:single-stranded-DNA-specific exonuclease